MLFRGGKSDGELPEAFEQFWKQGAVVATVPQCDPCSKIVVVYKLRSVQNTRSDIDVITYLSSYLKKVFIDSFR